MAAFLRLAFGAVLLAMPLVLVFTALLILLSPMPLLPAITPLIALVSVGALLFLGVRDKPCVA